MFDLSRMGLPTFREAHGRRWLCLYYVSQDDEHDFYIAAEAVEGGVLPTATSLIGVPLNDEKATAARRARRLKNENDAETAAITSKKTP